MMEGTIVEFLNMGDRIAFLIEIIISGRKSTVSVMVDVNGAATPGVDIGGVISYDNEKVHLNIFGVPQDFDKIGYTKDGESYHQLKTYYQSKIQTTA